MWKYDCVGGAGALLVEHETSYQIASFHSAKARLRLEINVMLIITLHTDWFLFCILHPFE